MVARAAANGVGLLALTDHDVTDGLAEARAAAAHHGVRLVNGVEISATWSGCTVHIVGLDIDPENAVLQAGLATLRETRNARAENIGTALEKAGVKGAFEGARALASGEILSRTHFARHLVAAGHAPDLARAFKKFLRRGRAGHTRSDWASLEEVTGWIAGAGGRAVLAHPARYPLGAGRLRTLLGAFVEAGGVGIEVISGSHNPGDANRFARLACEYGLAASVGSDFHDPALPWRDLGRLAPLPESCRPIWADWGINLM